jgi:hypothetical protein
MDRNPFRVQEWITFAMVVSEHIRNYTVPQYGDAPRDQVEEWTTDQCWESIARYCNRRKSNARGRMEQLRDIVKIAHYCCLIFLKMQPTIGEVETLKKGTV